MTTTAIAGESFDYYIVLRNTSAEPFHFETCPTYGHWITPSRVTPSLNTKGELEAVYRLAAKDTLLVLNCEAARDIAPLEGVTFAMRIAILPDAEPGEATLSWQMAQTPTRTIGASATIRIASR